MKLVLWATFAVLAALWTLGALLVVELVQWSAQAMASGAAAELGRSAAQWPLPAWLAAWLDPTAIRATQDILVTGFEALRGALPAIGSTLGWLVPLVWIAWAIGMVLLLAIACGAQWFLAHRQRLWPALPGLQRGARIRPSESLPH